VAERLGLTLGPNKQVSLPHVVELAELAERLGYHSIWVPETWGDDAATVLAVLSSNTQRIRLASGIFNVYSRSAALLAQTAAGLQHISANRFMLGLGTSGPIVIEGWHGVPFRHPIERTREYVDVIRLALSGEPVNYSGKELQLARFRLIHPPDAMVPIYIAALGPRNIRLAGEIADGWLPTFVARGHLAPLIAELRESAALAGRQPDELDIGGYLPAAFGPDGEKLLRQQLAYYIGGMGTFYYRFVSRLGFEGVTDQVRHHWQQGRHKEAVRAVSDDLLDLCTLGAEAATARERVATYRADGVTLPIVSIPHGASPQAVADALEALAPTL
jgi:coenzyme F420-dependent oxidoreductase